MGGTKQGRDARAIKIDRSRERDFRTVRNAITQGMNEGAYGVTNFRLRNPSYHWRLVGDRVEHKPTSGRVWRWMTPRDLDRPFSRGVFGRRVHFSPRALLLEVAEASDAASTEPVVEKPAAGPVQ